MTKQEIAEMYSSYLAEEGYSPKIDEDGDVVFKFEGGTYFVAIDEDDAEFFRVVLANIWAIESEAEGEKVLRAALHATSRTKVVKVLPVRDNTWASVEMFCSPPQSFRNVFPRALRSLQVGVRHFREKMQEG
jgi:hypothetical protein